MLQRRLSSELRLIRTEHFPSSVSTKSTKRHLVTVGIGGNIGDTIRRFEQVKQFFRRSALVDVIRTGVIVKNPPFGYTDQDDFYNSIITLKTNVQPKAFLQYLLEVERKFGRKRSFKDAPRTLDLDMIFFDDRKIKSDVLTLPHPSWQERDSVKIPLLGYR